MSKKIFFIDVEKCVACFNCFVACKDEFVDHKWEHYSEVQPDEGPAWIEVQEVERGQFPKVKVNYIPKPCMQCDPAPCEKAADNNAVTRRDDGILLIDPEKAKDQENIQKACPYNRIYWNQELDIPQKCTFCAHLLDQGYKEPRCVEVCPTRALRYGDIEEFKDEMDKAEQLRPELKRDSMVYYKGVPKAFVAGTVFYKETGECIESAKVKLETPAGILVCSTNNYGDFEFEGLEEDFRSSISIEADAYQPVVFNDLYVRKSVYMGEINLTKMG